MDLLDGKWPLAAQKQDNALLGARRLGHLPTYAQIGS
jgi:hypothetical protein